MEQWLKGKTSPVKSLLQKELAGKVLLLVSMSRMAQEPGFQEVECTTRYFMFLPKCHVAIALQELDCRDFA